MESFVRIAAPIVIALFGFVVFWVVARLIINRKDNEGETKNNSKDDKGAES